MTEQVSQYSIQQVQEAHQQLTQANDKFASGDVEAAMETCNELLESYPDYCKAHVMAAVIHMQYGNYAGALPHLIRALMVNANDPSVLANLGKVHLELGATECAVEALERSIALAPNEAMPHYFMGELHLTRNDFAQAAEHFETALAREPENSSAMIRLGHCQASVGRYEDALSTLQAALSMSVTDDQKTHIYQILSDFTVPLDGIDLLAELDELEHLDEADESPAQSRIYFTPAIPLAELSQAFARGIALDKAGRHQEAWNIFVDANKRIADETVPQREIYFTQGEALLERAHHWQPLPRSKNSKSTKDGPISLFILGPSRAGKTTLERLAGSLRQVRLGSEHTIVRDTAQRTSHRAGLLSERFLANLPSDLNEMISEVYHSELAAFAGDAQVATVTHPGVISDVGRLSDLVPDARFVLLKRDHDDMAFRIFAYLYQPHTNQFAYDIKDIYRYLQLHDDMVDTWAENLNTNALVLSYEDMVGNPEAAVCRLAELCGQKPPSNFDVQIASDLGCAAPYKEWLHTARDEKA